MGGSPCQPPLSVRIVTPDYGFPVTMLLPVMAAFSMSFTRIIWLPTVRNITPSVKVWWPLSDALTLGRTLVRGQSSSFGVECRGMGPGRNRKAPSSL
jgi:hypothetical protein